MFIVDKHLPLTNFILIFIYLCYLNKMEKKGENYHMKKSLKVKQKINPFR